MKKAVSVILVLVMILALSAVAFADSGITVTKNPTNEVRTAGATAWFVSGASSYTSLSWTFLSPEGIRYSVQDFRNRFPYASVEGEYSTTLTIRNLNTDMNNWGAFCTFYSGSASASTAVAYMYVSAAVAPAPTVTYTQSNGTTVVYETQPTAIVTGGTYNGYGHQVSSRSNYPDGSWVEQYYDGSWVHYDANTGLYSYGFNY